MRFWRHILNNARMGKDGIVMNETKAEKLIEWVRSKGIVSSVDVRIWGIQNYYIRADRTMRDLAELGQKVKRLTDSEIDSLGLRKVEGKRIAWWSAV